MERVLNIVSKMNADGAETFLIRLMRNINKDKFMFDFLVFPRTKASMMMKYYHGAEEFITPK